MKFGNLSCDTCKHSDSLPFGEPCSSCSNCKNWETSAPKSENQIYKEINARLRINAVELMVMELAQNQRLELSVGAVLPTCTPSDLDDALTTLCWIREDSDENGWEQDTWYWYSHPDYDFMLTMAYSGFYGGLQLYRRDCDD